MNTSEAILGFLVGVALSAACGFRVFVPMLVMSIAAKSGHLTLAPGFGWIASWPALVAFAVATAAEVCGYFIPWLDHLLDALATPTAVVAGIVVTAACVGGMSPWLKWSLAVVAGGGAAATVQGLTVVTRAATGATTGGLANPIVSSAEAAFSTVLSILAIVVPLIAAALAVLLVVAIIAILRRLLRRRRRAATTTPASA